MQNTRLNNLLETIYRSLSEWFLNPWRRLSLLLISFLFGFFLGSAVSTTAGQKAELDIVVAGFLVLLTEITSRIFYSRSFFFSPSILGRNTQLSQGWFHLQSISRSLETGFVIL
nr:DUF565 domain-containing protein [Aphanizomenon flos-aquae]